MCRFTSDEGKQSLGRVLCAYAAFDEEVNYCQVLPCSPSPSGVKLVHVYM